MKEYKKPIIMVNSDVAEGVYAASGISMTGPTGTADCWSYDIYPVQDWDGSSKVFELELTHHLGLEHISGATTIQIAFNSPVVSARSEFGCDWSGNVVTVTRTLLADAYQDGDLVTYKVWVQGADEATTKAMEVTGVGLSCDKQVNVQGNGGNE